MLKPICQRYNLKANHNDNHNHSDNHKAETNMSKIQFESKSQHDYATLCVKQC